MFNEILKYLREKNKEGQKDVASFLGVSAQSVSNYESGLREPEFDVLIKLSKHYQVTTDFLLGLASEPDPSDVRRIPVLGVIRAGLPILAEENWDEQITLSQYERGADFALRVTGDSMIYAGIRPGDIVLMQEAERAASGQIVAAVLQDGDAMATLKYYVDDGWQPVLRAANPKYVDQLVTAAHRIVGVYAGLVRTDEPGLRECEELIARAENLDENWHKAMTELTSAGLGPKDVTEWIAMMRRLKK